jgi:hypothetical protein
VDLLNRAVPGTRIVTKALERGAAYGPVEGAKTVLTEASGASFAKPKHRGAALLDADMQKAQMAVNDARRSLRWSMRNGTPAQVADAKKKLTEAAAEVQRLAKRLKAEKAAGYKAPKPNVEANRARIEANRKALTEGQ